MKTYEETKTTTKPRLEISYDEMAESPREWSNLGYFITVDSNYHSPDRHDFFEEVVRDTGQEAESLEEHIKMIKKAINELGEEKVIAIYPVNKYEHSGVSYSLGTAFGFDYSNNGFYIVTDKSQKEIGTVKKDFEKVIRQEIETYNQYANGQVYCFSFFDEDGAFENGCSGFYDINDIKDHLPDEWKDEDLDEYIIN